MPTGASGQAAPQAALQPNCSTAESTRPSSGPSRLAYVYICGSGHSGSTLLEMFLAGHSRMVAVGEIQNLAHQIHIGRVCSCGTLPAECPRWLAVRDYVQQRRGIDFLASPFAFRTSRERPVTATERAIRLWNRACAYARFRGGWWRWLPMKAFTPGAGRLIANNALVSDAVRVVAGRPIVVDSSKDYVRMREVLEPAPPGAAKVLYLVRDGRGCAWSFVKRQRGSLEWIAREWAKNQRRTRAMLAGVPAGLQLRVQYERLCSEPAACLAEICVFLGLEYEPAMLELAPPEHHTIAGNQIRVQRRMEVRLDEGWKSGLSADDLRRFDEIAGEENCRLGYG